jgi:hypothetical protein
MPIRAEMRWFYPIDWPQISRHEANVAHDGGRRKVSAVEVGKAL